MIKEISKLLKTNEIFHKIEGEYIVTKRSRIKIPLINKDVAYILGVFEGDGSLSKSKRPKGGYHYTIRIYSEKEIYLREYNKILTKQFNIHGKIIRDKRKKSAFYLVIKNSILYNTLTYLGLESGKKKVGKIPSAIAGNKEYFVEYLAGLVDTDGSVDKSRIQLKQKRENLIKQIHIMTDNYSLNPTVPKINYTNNKPYWYIRFDNKVPLRMKKTFKAIVSHNPKPA